MCFTYLGVRSAGFSLSASLVNLMITAPSVTTVLSMDFNTLTFAQLDDSELLSLRYSLMAMYVLGHSELAELRCHDGKSNSGTPYTFLRYHI